MQQTRLSRTSELLRQATREAEIIKIELQTLTHLSERRRLFMWEGRDLQQKPEYEIVVDFFGPTPAFDSIDDIRDTVDV